MRNNRGFSLDSMAQEYTSYGVGDFRVSSIAASCSDGSRCVEFTYVGHEISDGKYSIPGLPSVYDNGQEAQTLIVTLIDRASQIRINLYYGVFEELDIITRATQIINGGNETVWLRKASSMCLEMGYDPFLRTALYGASAGTSAAVSWDPDSFFRKRDVRTSA